MAVPRLRQRNSICSAVYVIINGITAGFEFAVFLGLIHHPRAIVRGPWGVRRRVDTLICAKHFPFCRLQRRTAARIKFTRLTGFNRNMLAEGDTVVRAQGTILSIVKTAVHPVLACAVPAVRALAKEQTCAIRGTPGTTVFIFRIIIGAGLGLNPPDGRDAEVADFVLNRRTRPSPNALDRS